MNRRRVNRIVAPSLLFCAAAASSSLAQLTPEQRADPNTGQIPNPSPITQEYYIGPIGLNQSTTGAIVGAVSPDKASLSWYKFTSDGVSPIIFDTYGTHMGFGLNGFGSTNDGELAVYDNTGHYIAGNQGSQRPASGDSNYPPLGAPAPGVTTRQPINPTLPVDANDPNTHARNDQDLANLAFVKNPESNPLWDPSNPNYTFEANWNQFPILPAGTYFLAVTGFSTYFSGFARDASEIDDPNNANYTKGITSSTPFGYLTFHAMSGTYQLNERLAGDFDQNGTINAADIRLLRLQAAHYHATLGIATAGFLSGDTTQPWEGLPNNPGDPSSDLQRYDLTGNARIDLYDVAAWGRYTGNPTSMTLTWNNSPASGGDPLNPEGPGDGATWMTLGGQNFADSIGPDVFLDGDTVQFTDANNGNYNVTIPQSVNPAAVVINNSAGNYTISGLGTIGGSGGLTKLGSGNLTLATSNSFTGATSVGGGTLLLSGSIASTSVQVNAATATLFVAATGALPATANLNISAGQAIIAPATGAGIRPRTLGSVAVSGTGSVLLQSPASYSQRTVLSIGALTITGGKVDLANNDLILTSTPLSSVQGYLATGFGNGSWNGNGLTSSVAQAIAGNPAITQKTAIGYATAASVNLTSFDGLAVNPTDVLVRYTYGGDANLDGTVNALDFNALATNFGQAGTHSWIQGDFNYDGHVNSSDFVLLSKNFGVTLPAADLSLGTEVPEPSLGALCFAASMLTQRWWRRRQSLP